MIILQHMTAERSGMKSDLKPAVMGVSGSARYIGVGRTSFWNKRNPRSKAFDPTLPKPIRFKGVEKDFYRTTDLDAWVARRPMVSDAEET